MRTCISSCVMPSTSISVLSTVATLAGALAPALAGVPCSGELHLEDYGGMDWDDYARNLAVRSGRWKAEHPVERPTAIAFGPLESWYSPFVSLSKAAADFLTARPIAHRGLHDVSKGVVEHTASAFAAAASPQP